MGSITRGQTAKRPERINKDRVTRVRMDDEDIAILDTYADYGFSSRSELIRELLHWWDEGCQDFSPETLVAPGKQAPADPQLSELAAIVDRYVKSVNAVGNNLNQVASDLNRRRKAEDKRAANGKCKPEDREPLDRSDWNKIFKVLLECTDAIEQSNQVMLKLKGVQGTPSNFAIPKPLKGGK